MNPPDLAQLLGYELVDSLDLDNIVELKDVRRASRNLDSLGRYALIQLAIAEFESLKLADAEFDHRLDNGAPIVRCPHCEAELEEVVEVDYSTRRNAGEWRNAGEFHPRADTIVFQRQNGDHDTLCYQCPECLHPFDLPDEVEVEWG